MNEAPRPENTANKPSNNQATKLGPAVFAITFVAVLVFFWWMLIYDHGAPTLH